MSQTKIFVHDFITPALIGIYPHEHENMQRIRVCIDVTLNMHHVEHDDIQHTVSYEGLAEAIRNLSKQHFNLVETLAEHLAGIALKDPRAHTAIVRVEKLDVYAEGSVGTEITRTRT